MKALIKKMRDSKKIDPADSLGKVKNMRALFLLLNREKPKQFSFSPKYKELWRLFSFKANEFESNMRDSIHFLEYSLDVAKHNAKRTRTTKNEAQKKVEELQNELNYYNLTLKTLKKYDKNYSKKIGLTLHRLFCKDISLHIREFI